MRRGIVFVASALLTWSALHALAGDAGGTVEGTVTVAERLRGRTGRIVVYLEPAGGEPAGGEPAGATSFASPGGARHTISQKDAQFHPSFLCVARGDTIEFRNDEPDDLEHNVFSASETQSFDLGLYGKGRAKTVTFETPGEVAIYCSIHKLMEATVYVAPTPFRADVDETALRFKLENVPAGKWRARTWISSKRAPNASALVDLPPGGKATVELPLGGKKP